MENTYEIVSCPDNVYKFIVVNTNYESLTYKFDQISSDLRSKNYKGPVLLDYILSTGSLKKRYFEAYFNGEQIDSKTVIIKKDIDPKLQILINRFFTNNTDLIERSIVSKPIKYCLRHAAI